MKIDFEKNNKHLIFSFCCQIATELIPLTMHWHHIISISLKISLLVAFVIILFILFNKWLQHKERAWAFVLKQDNNKVLSPLRISAYERIVVMLERISPQSLVLRYHHSTTSSALLQMEIIKAIREEFDHNISLQMYVSKDCWDKVKIAKEETTELIKVAFTKVRPESPAVELSREILKLEAAVGSSAIREALHGIRIEMAKYY